MSHLPHLIIDLTLILGAAAVVAIVFRFIKQPLVLGYILAGFFVGPNFSLFPTIVEHEGIKIWAEIGVLFLLFGLGLEFSFKKLFKIGGVASVTALFGVGFTMLAGYFAGKFIGWTFLDSLYLGGILAIASTTIIIRAFEELHVKNKKFANLVLGVLVIEDLVAVVLMVVLSTVSISRTVEGPELIYALLKLLFFLVLWFVSGIFFLPSIIKLVRKFLTDELLLILSLAFCFLLAFLAYKAGFSPALGAFIMGSILAETTIADKIEHNLVPLKNLFGAIFFVSVGMLIDPKMLMTYWSEILLATMVLLIVKPLFVFIGGLLTGQPLRVSVQAGMSLSQIGEFSFIIATLGLTLGVTSTFLYPVAVAVSLVTTFTTPFMIQASDKVANFLENRLPAKWIVLLQNYSNASQRVRELSVWQKLIRYYTLNVVIFSVISFTLILVSTNYIVPEFSDSPISKFLVALLTLVAISPFLWALVFRRASRDLYTRIWTKPIYRGPLIGLVISRILLALFFVGLLFHRIYSPFAAVFGVIITAFILFLLRKKIKNVYLQLEGRFIKNFNAKSNASAKVPDLISLGAYITPIQLSTHDGLTGLTLAESKIRERFGVNFALIKRKEMTIPIPTRHDRLYPNDLVYVIGTDLQIENFRGMLRQSQLEPQDDQAVPSISLHSLVITEDSEYLNKSIEASGIRNLSKGLVIGVERSNTKILNPESDFVLVLGDIVWIAGDDMRLLVMNKQSE